MYTSKADLHKLIKELSDKIFITGLLSPRRPGVMLFARTLELKFYPPYTSLNDLFDCKVYKLDDYICEIICIVPSKDYLQVTAHAKECGLNMKLGSINLLTPQGLFESSNLPDGRVYTLSNLEGHVVYGASSEQLQELFKAEDELLELEEQKFEHTIIKNRNSILR